MLGAGIGVSMLAGGLRTALLIWRLLDFLANKHMLKKYTF